MHTSRFYSLVDSNGLMRKRVRSCSRLVPYRSVLTFLHQTSTRLTPSRGERRTDRGHSAGYAHLSHELKVTEMKIDSAPFRVTGTDKNAPTVDPVLRVTIREFSFFFFYSCALLSHPPPPPPLHFIFIQLLLACGRT